MHGNRRIIHPETGVPRRILRDSNGFVLMYAVVFLTISMMCSSFLLVSLSDQRHRILAEQNQLSARWMAESGWNLGLEHLQNGMGADVLHWSDGGAECVVTITDLGNEKYMLVASGSAGDYESSVSGLIEKTDIDCGREEESDPENTEPDAAVSSGIEDETEKEIVWKVLSRTLN